MKFKAKRAVICGASRGIGKAIAIRLAKQGMDTLLIARDAHALKEVADTLDISQGQEHKCAAVDFMNPQDVKVKVSEFINNSSPYHILINNTGGPSPGPLVDAELQELADAFTMHILTSQTLMQLVVPGMQQAGHGRIVNIISTSVKEPIEGLGVSNTIRGAMGNWSKTLSTELGSKGITVNNVLPGFTMTDRLTSIIDTKSVTAGVPNDIMEERMKMFVPARRFAEADELAATVAFLCSDEAGYINGVNLPVDGGRTKSL